MKLLKKIQTLFRKEKIDAEMAEEMRLHLERRTQANLAAGMSADEARYAAQRQFGGVDQLKETAREQRGGVWLEQLFQDLRYAVRQLRRTPGFATVAVLSLALGIGANTAIFSLVDDVLLKMLPVKNPSELVLFHWASKVGWVGQVSGSWEMNPVTKVATCTSFSARAFESFRDNNSTLAAVCAFAPITDFTLIVDGQAEASQAFGGQVVSGGYYAALGVPAIVGRTITPEDDRPGAEPVAVISHRYWQRRFNGDPAVVGKAISVNRTSVVIVGVTPPQFVGALDVGNAPDISLPLAMLPAVDPNISKNAGLPGGMWWLRVMGRLKPGATSEQARANLEGVFHQSAVEDAAAMPSRGQVAGKPANEIPQLGLEPGGQGLNSARHSYTQMLMVLTGLVGLVLVIACANVANLLLARGAARRREIAARLALGASRSRLVRQLLTESGLLVLLGAAAGVLVAYWGRVLLAAMNPLGTPVTPALELSAALDGRVLGFTVMVAVASGLLFGLVPALRATRVDLSTEFQGGSRTLSGGNRSRLAKTLLIVQVALSLVLLVGAGLFVRTLRNLQSVDVGIKRERLLLFELTAWSSGTDHAGQVTLHQRVLERIGAIPGVRSATFSRMPLLTGGAWNTRVAVPGHPPPRGKTDTAMLNAVDGDFFTTFGIPVILGRTFTRRDDAQATKVVVINETMAHQFFGDENPVGRRFERIFGPNKTDLEIVGVVGDARYASVKGKIPATAYLPFSQEPEGWANYAVRTNGDPEAMVASIRAAVREIDPNLPLANVRTQEAQIEKLFARERLFARFSSFFGVLALALVCVGLYGLMSYAVTCRTGEIGIRIALGALPRRVLGMILRESLTLVMAGAAIGLAAASLLTSTVEKMLFGVVRFDPATYGAMTLLLAVAALLAAWLPARRAAKVDPMVALRCE